HSLVAARYSFAKTGCLFVNPAILMSDANKPTRARALAGTSIAATGVPAALATHGMRFWAMNPPRLPIVLIAAIAMATRCPEKNNEGRNQRQGKSNDIQGVPIDIATIRIQF